ncbi:hypothetical protein ABZ924_37640 [Streptomyces sp. NPDC046876]|uniref:hypothetical protein n=1 Tax=Streptomyces sp. NPDC046876 TaxID=3155616 RepID=UPI0033ED73F0
MSPRAWRALSHGADDAVTLVVDFTGSGREQAQFADLAPLLDPPLTVWASLPPLPGDEVARTGGAYLDWWLAGLREEGTRVAAVAGYCAGSVFAAALADRIGEWQERPQVILLDPELPSCDGMFRNFHGVGGTLAAVLDEAELAAFHAVGNRLEQQGGPDGTGAVASTGLVLEQAFGEAVATTAERLDLDDDIRDELSGAFSALVGYLTAAADLADPAAWAGATAVTSAAPRHPVGRELRIDVPHDDLLRAPAAARAVSALIASDRHRQPAGR